MQDHQLHVLFAVVLECERCNKISQWWMITCIPSPCGAILNDKQQKMRKSGDKGSLNYLKCVKRLTVGVTSDFRVTGLCPYVEPSLVTTKYQQIKLC